MTGKFPSLKHRQFIEVVTRLNKTLTDTACTKSKKEAFLHLAVLLVLVSIQQLLRHQTAKVNYFGHKHISSK